MHRTELHDDKQDPISIHTFAIFLEVQESDCNEHGTIYAISSDFGDRMTTQSM